MPAATFSLGKDIQAIIITPEGGRLNIKNITKFTQNWNTKKVTSAPLNGPPQQADLPAGWNCEVDFDRADNTVDAYFALREAAFWAGQAYANGTSYIYITEIDGSQSRYQFNNCSFSFNAGSWTAEDKVSQKIMFFASTRTAI